MTSSSPSLPAGEDLQHSTRRSAKGLLLRFLVREGLQLSTEELVAIAHALGEVAIADSHGVLRGTLDTIGIDTSGRVHVHAEVAPSLPAVHAIKRELEQLAPVARDASDLRRMLALPARGAEEYLDRLAAFSVASPRDVLAALVGRWMAQYARAWATEDPAQGGLESDRISPEAATRFGRQRARHGGDIPCNWASESPAPWQERRRTSEPLAASGGWNGHFRVLLFVGEEIQPTPTRRSHEPAPWVGEVTTESTPGQLSLPLEHADLRSGLHEAHPSNGLDRATQGSSDLAERWHRAGETLEGVRRTMLRYVRAHSPFGASQPS